MPENGGRLSFDGVLTAVVVGILLVATGLTLRPFLPAILWSIVLAVTAAPLHARVAAAMPRWPRFAAVVTSLALVLILVVPAIGMTRAVIQYTPAILVWIDQVASTPLTEAPESIRGIPMLGDLLSRNWELLYRETSSYLAHFRSDIEEWLVWAFQEMATVGLFVFEFGLAVIFAGVFLAHQDRLSAFAEAFFARIGGPFAVQLLDHSVRATRSTVRGVVGSALAEAAVAMFAYWIAGVPAWLVLGALTFFAALVQVGAPLIWIPVAIWLFVEGEPGWALFMVLWGMIVVYMVENLSRPLLVSRAAELPGLLIFVGVLGGLVAWGLIGVFLGPVILAVAYELVIVWLRQTPAGGPAAAGRRPPHPPSGAD